MPKKKKKPRLDLQKSRLDSLESTLANRKSSLGFFFLSRPAKLPNTINRIFEPDYSDFYHSKQFSWMFAY